MGEEIVAQHVGFLSWYMYICMKGGGFGPMKSNTRDSSQIPIQIPTFPSVVVVVCLPSAPCCRVEQFR